MAARGLPSLLRSELADHPADQPLVVAVSGGRDSTALLHLLRFGAGIPAIPLTVAHFDHRMRPSSAADADWVRGVGTAWRVPCVVGVADEALRDEAEARAARYAFLHRVREDAGAAWVLTAHHADDQAETVLYRVLRGTGVRGLRGMPRRRAPGVWRPLLPVPAADLAAYARSVGLRWREDPTNRSERPRAVLRREILPRAAEAVAPDPVAALGGLARRAAADEGAWASLMDELLSGLQPRWTDQGVDVLRAPLLDRHPGVRARLLRHLARALDRPLDGAGTRTAMEFTTRGSSGGVVHLGGGLRLARELDRLALRVARDAAEDRPLIVDAASAGAGTAVLDGVAWRVVWDHRPGPSGVAFARDALEGPLEVRAWRPGDRMRLDYGSKKLKKLFLEARMPASRRHRTPVVVDRAGTVLWVPGVAQSTVARPDAGGPCLHMEITRADID